MTVTYLVTGASRGIGLEFVNQLVQRSDVHIFATTQIPDKATKLNELAKSSGKVTVLQWRADHEEDSARLAEAVKKDGKLDVLIANSGISKNLSPVAKTEIKSLLEHINVNVGGNIHLFAALYPFLEASPLPGGGVFFPISSVIASIGQPMPFANTSYGVSKAALNYVGKHISLQHEKIKVILAHPGVVKTDILIDGLKEVGLDVDNHNIPGVVVIEPRESVNKLLAMIDGAEKIPSGSFLSLDGSEIPF